MYPSMARGTSPSLVAMRSQSSRESVGMRSNTSRISWAGLAMTLRSRRWSRASSPSSSSASSLPRSATVIRSMSSAGSAARSACSVDRTASTERSCPSGE